MHSEIKTQKYWVSKKGLITIQCLSCQKAKTITAESLQGKKHIIRAQCPCGHIFNVEIDFRQSYRRKVNFPGTYRMAASSPEKARACTVVDLSFGGMGIQIFDDPSIKVYDELVISFRLDDKNMSQIDKTIAVRHVNSGNEIGGKFTDRDKYTQEKALHFYLT